MFLTTAGAGVVACALYYQMGSWSADSIPEIDEEDKSKKLGDEDKDTKRKTEDPTVDLTKWQVLLIVLQHFAEHARHWRIAAIFGLGLLTSIGEMFTPYYIGKIFDSFRNNETQENQMKYVHYLLSTICIRQFGYMFRRKIRRDAVRLYQTKTQGVVLEHVTKLELAFFDRTTTGELVDKLGRPRQTEEIMFGIVDSFQAILFMLCTMCMMIQTNAYLGLIALAMVTISWLWTTYGPLQIWHKHGSKICHLSEQLAVVHTEAMQMIRTIKAFGVEKETNEGYKKAQTSYRDADFIWHTWWAVNDFGWDLWGRLSVVATLWLAAVYFVPAGVISIGSLYTIIIYQSDLGGTFSRLGDRYSNFLKHIRKGRDYLKLLLQKPKIKKNGTYIPKKIEGCVEFTAVDFKYPSRQDDAPVLKNFNLKVTAGKVFALVGHSGCGKSTVLKLIQRMYEPDSGLITIDGIPLGDWDHDTLVQRGMSIVEQDPGLFAKTIKENIICGLNAEDVKMEDVIHACKQANAHDFISELPKGYDSLVGERGVMLSGGQKQRICIARALVRNPRVLLLDEATSSLDCECEAKVQEALERSMEGRTVVIVAHRLSTVRNADCICVLVPGKGIVESGTHDQLLRKNGEYARFVQKQLTHAPCVNVDLHRPGSVKRHTTAPPRLQRDDSEEKVNSWGMPGLREISRQQPTKM